MKKRLLLSVFFVFMLLLAGGFLHTARAATGTFKQINFQGKVVNKTSGTNVADASYTFVFSIYSVSSGGAAVWTETKPLSTVNGIFQTLLGDTTSLPGSLDFNTDNLYLGITFNGDTEMVPRVRFATVPQAMNALKVAGLTVTDTTGTLTIPNSKTISFGDAFTTSGANALTLTTSGTTNVTLPTTGTLLSNTASGNQTVTSTQTSGTLVGLTDNTNITAATTGLVITLGGTGAFDQTGLQFNLSGASGTNLNDIVGSGSTWKVSKGGALTVTSCSGCGGVGGTNYWQTNSTVLTPGNVTLDLSVGGISTSAAKFFVSGTSGNVSIGSNVTNAAPLHVSSGYGSNATVIVNQLNSGNIIAASAAGATKFVVANNGSVGIGTATPLDALHVASGNVRIGAQTNSALTAQNVWSRISGTAGTIGGNSTTAIASVSASAVFDGSLYVGTSKSNAAEVYRYSGTSGTWTVMNGTAGTFGGQTSVDAVTSMTVFNGNLYIGTREDNTAEIWRYDGGTTWTRVSQSTPGTIASAGTASIDGISSMAVYNGRLYVGTRELPGNAQIYRYEGGTTWTLVNTTANTLVTTNCTAQAEITAMTIYMNTLVVGTTTGNRACLLRYTGNVGASVFIVLNNTTQGQFSVNGANVSSIDGVTSLAVLNGALVVGIAEGAAGADVYLMDPMTTTVTAMGFRRLNSAAGTIGTTATVAGVQSLGVYNGRLYVGTAKANAAEIWRYDGAGTTWNRVSGGTGVMGAGAGSNIDSVGKLIPYNDALIAGIEENGSGAAEVYTYTTAIDQSYKLVFEGSTTGGGGVSNSLQNLGAISFTATSSASMGSNGQMGSFLFSHGIMTQYGAYDVAEDYPTRDETLTPGDVVSIDPYEKGFVRSSTEPYDRTVVGVYSENPGLRLSQAETTIGDAHAIPVALVGRVPVRVSTENGPIHTGDMLTASSQNGVAMKASKAGSIIGKALEEYDGTQTGKIMVFVAISSSLGAYDTSGLSSTTANLDSYHLHTQSTAILSQLITRQDTSHSSEVSTDRVIAGLEIVTPSLTADTITARIIRADRIEGLEILTQHIGELDTAVQTLVNSKVSTDSAEVAQKDVSEPPFSITSAGDMQIPQGLTIMKDLSVQGKSLFVSVAEFAAESIFHGDVQFFGHVLFNHDTAGIAVITKDAQSVDVVFDRPYTEAPLITFSPIFEGEHALDVSAFFSLNFHSAVTRRTENGFTLQIDKDAPFNIPFTWIAIPVKIPKTSRSSGIVSGTQTLTITPAASPQPTPASTPEPTEGLLSVPDTTPSSSTSSATVQ